MRVYSTLFATLSLAGLVLQTAPAVAQKATTLPTSTAAMKTVTFRLRYIAPTTLLNLLMNDADRKQGSNERFLPNTIRTLAVDDVAKTLTVKAPPTDVERLRTVIALLDAPSETVRLQVKIFRFEPNKSTPGGTPKRYVIATAICDISNNQSTPLLLAHQAQLFRLSLTPKLHRDGSIAVSGTMHYEASIPYAEDSGIKGITQQNVQQISTTERMKSGETRIIAAVTEYDITRPTGKPLKLPHQPSDHEIVAKRTQDHHLLENGYQLEVTPIVLSQRKSNLKATKY